MKSILLKVFKDEYKIVGDYLKWNLLCYQRYTIIHYYTLWVHDVFIVIYEYIINNCCWFLNNSYRDCCLRMKLFDRIISKNWLTPVFCAHLIKCNLKLSARIVLLLSSFILLSRFSMKSILLFMKVEVRKEHKAILSRESYLPVDVHSVVNVTRVSYSTKNHVEYCEIDR